MRNKSIARAHGKKCGADGRHIGQHQRHAQHPGSVLPQPCDGRRDKTDDDQRHAEGDDLTDHLFQGNDDVHKDFIGVKSRQDPQNNPRQKSEWKTL